MFYKDHVPHNAYRDDIRDAGVNVGKTNTRSW